MKKLFMFLAVAGLATFGASCSSDDNSTPPPPTKEKQLVLSADKASIKEGESVTFTVKVDKDVVQADLYIQGTPEVKISNTHKFDTKGEYKVVAKKADHKTSSVVTITVKGEDVPGVEKKLVLTPTKNEVFVGESVTFSVKDEDGAVVSGFTVNNVAGGVVPNGIFQAQAAGTFKFTASKTGYVTSSEVSVVVKTRPALTTNFFQYEGIQYAVDEALFVYQGTQNFNGGLIDTYLMVVVKMDGEEIDNRILGLVAFPRTTAGVQLLPQNGQVGVAAWGGFEFTAGGEELETPVVTAATTITLSGMTFTDVEAGVKGAANGKIEYTFGLTGTENKLTGLYEGQVIVLTDAPAANAIRSAYSNGQKNVKMTRKQ